MKNFTSLIALFLMLAGAATAQKPELAFNEQGEFKIAQLTDTHINLNKSNSKHVFDLIKLVYETENPDLFVFTGDVVLQDYPQTVYKMFSKMFDEYQTPWAVVLGNHEDEQNTTRADIGKLLTSYPLCVNIASPAISGVTNFIVPLKGNENNPAALLYFLDSNAYSKLKDRVDGYGWFDVSQVAWYKEQSAMFTNANGGMPLPALAFFHIPLPEYNTVWDDENIIKIGEKNEDVCCPKLNSGMFTAMVECGDVMGTFVGHDHVNDYIGCLYDIALAYGRASGGKNTYGDRVNGGRIILLKEGERRFDIWIRQTDGSVDGVCVYPDSFVVKK